MGWWDGPLWKSRHDLDECNLVLWNLCLLNRAGPRWDTSSGEPRKSCKGGRLGVYRIYYAIVHAKSMVEEASTGRCVVRGMLGSALSPRI